MLFPANYLRDSGLFVTTKPGMIRSDNACYLI